MSEVAPAPISRLLKENSALQRIFAKVQQLKQLNEVLMTCLDPKLRRHCVVANIYTDKLVVLAENAAIATQFRFYIPELLPLLRQKHPLFRELKTIECKLGSERTF
jgi:hypothetical protein